MYAIIGLYKSLIYIYTYIQLLCTLHTGKSSLRFPSRLRPTGRLRLRRGGRGWSHRGRRRGEERLQSLLKFRV